MRVHHRIGHPATLQRVLSKTQQHIKNCAPPPSQPSKEPSKPQPSSQPRSVIRSQPSSKARIVGNTKSTKSIVIPIKGFPLPQVMSIPDDAHMLFRYLFFLRVLHARYNETIFQFLKSVWSDWLAIFWQVSSKDKD